MLEKGEVDKATVKGEGGQNKHCLQMAMKWDNHVSVIDTV